MPEKHQFFITVLTTFDWMKPVQQAKLLFLTQTLVMGTLRTTPANPAGISISSAVIVGR